MPKVSIPYPADYLRSRLTVTSDTAGAGKTVLTSSIIDDLIDQCLGVTAFYYFSFQRRDLQSLRQFKYALMVQIIKSLGQPHDKNQDMIYMPQAFQKLRKEWYPSRDPATASLDQTLLEVAGKPSRIFIIVDALDECDNGQVRYELLKFLKSLLYSSSTNVLFTSRPEPAIADAFSGLSIDISSVPFDNRSVNKDIHDHLRLLMTELPYSRWSLATQAKAIAVITSGADGVFRWAELQIQQLRGKMRDVDVDRALGRLPRGLSETYKRMLERIDFQDYRPEAMAVLRWLSRCMRPLSVAEVAELAAFEEHGADGGSTQPDNRDHEVSFVPGRRFNSPSEILHILGGLVTVSGPLGSNVPLQDLTIEFSHFSVGEYLASNEVYPRQFQLQPANCDRFIASCCQGYIAHYDTVNDDRSVQRGSYPLLLYCCFRLCEHLRKVASDLHDDPAKRFFLPDGGPEGYALSVALRRDTSGEAAGSDRISDFIRTLYENGTKTRASGRPTVPLLQSAAAFDDKRLIKLFLDSGTRVPNDILLYLIRPNTPQTMFGPLAQARSLTPSAAKSANERAQIWNLLLACPEVNLNCTNSFGQTPLQLAALNRDAVFFSFMFGREDVHIGHTECHGWGLLTCALIGGDKAIVDDVLAKDHDLASKDHYGWTALDWALHCEYDFPESTFAAVAKLGNASAMSSPFSFDLIKQWGFDAVETWIVAFSHNGKYLAVGLSTGKVEIRDVYSSGFLCVLHYHRHGIASISWSPDDSRLVTCSLDNSAKLCEIKVRRPLPTWNSKYTLSNVSLDGAVDHDDRILCRPAFWLRLVASRPVLHLKRFEQRA
jgi:hypothetical protein